MPQVSDELLQQVFTCIRFQPVGDTKEKVREIIDSCIGEQEDAWTISTAICDYLDIERRHNRPRLNDVIHPYIN